MWSRNPEDLVSISHSDNVCEVMYLIFLGFLASEKRRWLEFYESIQYINIFFPLVRFRTTTGLDSAVDPVQMKNVTFEHVKGVS